jgi:hypothetical protein
MSDAKSKTGKGKPVCVLLHTRNVEVTARRLLYDHILMLGTEKHPNDAC